MDRGPEHGGHGQVAAVARERKDAVMFLASNICWVARAPSGPGTAGLPRLERREAGHEVQARGKGTEVRRLRAGRRSAGPGIQRRW